ncbi:MAG: hypothetical protein HC782_00395, partial [Gammaproteobacteria bacterium]|nr:hypothetical protein [Gammaproteobacteria bacterium]
MPLYHSGNLAAWRDGYWKINFYSMNSRTLDIKKLERPSLYHLARDPGEKYDIAQTEKDVVARLTAAARAFEASFTKAEPEFDRRVKAPLKPLPPHPEPAKKRPTMTLKFSEKLAYGMGDFASNLIFATVSTFLMYYYTDIYGLEAVVVGTLLFVARFIDAVWDLYLGTIIDRTRTRWGQCRPYMLFASPILAVCVIATFTVPAGSDAFKLVYAYITYTLLMCTYSLVNIPYIAMPALMTDD